MGFWNKLSNRSSNREVLGWTEGTQVAMINVGKLHSDHGYKLVFVLFPLGSNRAIECDCSDFVLQMASGKTVSSLGVALSLDENFRCQPGQWIPTVLPARKVSWRQDSGSHYAHVFSVWGKEVPSKIIALGKAHSLGAMLPQADNDKSRGGATRTQGQALGSMSLAAGVPYTYRCEDPRSLISYHPPDEPNEGLVAIWKSPEITTVVVRVPPSLADCEVGITEEGMRVILENGSSVSARGVVLQIHQQVAPYGLANKFQIGFDKTILSPGGTLEFLYDYQGPSSVLLPQDCKLAVAVAPEVEWKSVRGFSMPGYESKIPDGTLIF